MDWLRKELNDNYSNTFQYNQQGDPESVFFLFNKVLRRIMGKNTSNFDSVLLENGSIEVTSQNFTERNTISQVAKFYQARKLGSKRLSQLYGISPLASSKSIKSNLQRIGEEEEFTNAVIDDYFSYDYLHSTFEKDGAENVR